MTDTRFTTCLWFDGQAEDAANFYATVFENASVGQIARYPGDGGSVMTVEFEINGQRFVGLNGGPQFKFTEAISFQIPCQTQEEVDYYWDRLTADGGEEGPCGWVKDKFGLSWQVVPNRLLELTTGPDAGQAARAFDAMMSMHKLDIAALEKAAAG